MKKPVWPFSGYWSEADEIRLSNAAKDLDALANELSTLASTCCNQGKNSLSSSLITDAGTHYEDELNIWKQNLESNVVANLRASAAAIRATVATRQTMWDKFVDEVNSFNAWAKEAGEELMELFS